MPDNHRGEAEDTIRTVTPGIRYGRSDLKIQVAQVHATLEVAKQLEGLNHYLDYIHNTLQDIRTNQR